LGVGCQAEAALSNDVTSLESEFPKADTKFLLVDTFETKALKFGTILTDLRVYLSATR